MSFGGSVLAMIQSIKSNGRSFGHGPGIDNTKHPEKRTFIKKTDKSEAEVEAIKAKIRKRLVRKRVINNLVMLVVVIVFLVWWLYHYG